MLLALIRRVFLFLAFLLLTSYGLIFIHALVQGGTISLTSGVGAGAAGFVLAVCWMGMVKTDDYLNPWHTRAFFGVTAAVIGIIGAALYCYFAFSDEHPSAYLVYFGMGPAGIAALFVVIAVIRIKEAYSLPSEYRPEASRFQWGILPISASVPALIIGAVALGLTVKEVKTISELRVADQDIPAETEVLDGIALQIRADETFQLAKRQQEMGHYRSAFDLFRQAADYGHVEADFELALIYTGEGYLRNMELARTHLEKAAAAGHQEAAFRLGKAFRHGELGLERDIAKARDYFETAAEAGHVEAQTQLGHVYNRGEGVEPDQEKAFHWFLKAAEQGDAIAQNDVGIFYLQGKGVEADPLKGIHWLTLAADAGVAVAEYNLGRALYTGEVVPQDYDRAHTYFQNLAEKNIPYGFQMLGLQYLEGKGPAKDETAAFEAFAEGAARRDTISQYYLGFCYLHGLGTEKDSSAALEHLGAAAAKGHLEAQLLLGQINLAGTAILQDKAEALKWFTLAAESGSNEAEAELKELEANMNSDEISEAAERIATFHAKAEK